MKRKISKEDFKVYLNECPKIAWIFYSEKNLNITKTYLNNELIVIHGITDDDLDEDIDTTKFSFLDVYNKYYKDKNSILDYDIEALINENEENDIGVQNLTPLNETVEDGLSVGNAAIEYYKSKLEAYNQKNNTNKKIYDFSSFNFVKSLEKTKEIIKDDNYLYLFEPSFEFDNRFRVKCDVLINKGNNHFVIVEFKASTKSNLEYFYDVIYQKYVLEKNGFIIDDVYIGLINPEYIKGSIQEKTPLSERFDEQKYYCPDYYEIIEPKLKSYKIEEKYIDSDIDYDRLIKTVNYLESSKSYPDFIDIYNNIFGEKNKLNLDKIFEDMENDFNNERFLLEPECKKLKYDYKEIDASFKRSYCHHVVSWYDQNDYSIYDFTRFKKKAALLYNEFGNEVDIKNIVNPESKNYFVDGKQIFKDDEIRLIKVIQSKINNNPNWSNLIVDRNRLNLVMKLLSDYLDTPVYMYDFETVKWAIPKYNNSFSYQQIPFQYSIHTLISHDFDYKTLKKIEHRNFIANEQKDPRIKFLNNFIRDCFEFGPGVYVAYNKSFERTVLKNAIIQFPEVAEPLKYIYSNTIDLMEFFKRKKTNWLIYHPDFKGSYSIKKTQPVMAPDLSYKDLVINKGDNASKIFRQYLDDYISHQEFEKFLKQDMLKYCDRDTLAMVALLQRIFDYASKYIEIKEGRIMCRK